MEVLIGVDPHKATNVVAAVDEQGEALGRENFPADRKGMRALERWVRPLRGIAHSHSPGYSQRGETV